MKKKKIVILMLVALLALSFTGCASKKEAAKLNTVNSSNSNKTNESNTKAGDNTSKELPNLKVTFGKSGNGFTLKTYNNATTAEIVRYVGEADWNLPIYHFDDFENYKVMQYYDIPGRYKITSNPETITSEKAGEVYYSTPNRIILFYQDAQVKGEFTKVGYIENIQGLKEAVENNPVVEGWGNKIVSISPGK